MLKFFFQFTFGPGNEFFFLQVTWAFSTYFPRIWTSVNFQLQYVYM